MIISIESTSRRIHIRSMGNVAPTSRVNWRFTIQWWPTVRIVWRHRADRATADDIRIDRMRRGLPIS